MGVRDAGGLESVRGGLVRGPRDQQALALCYTGDQHGESMPAILEELARRGGKASFFFTGRFLRDLEFRPYVQRRVADGHYLGPHSDQHLLYCEMNADS